MSAFRGVRNACLIQLVMLVVACAACSACTHEGFDKWASERLGWSEGACVDGELELFPPHCELNATKTTTTKD